MRDVELDPVIFQFYFSFVVFLLSFIVLAWNPWEFSWWGFLSAGIWVPSSLFSIVAVEKLGLSVAQGFWSGIVIITNFVWGVAFFNTQVSNIYLTIFGLTIMVIGIVGVATCSKWNTEPPSEKQNSNGEDKQPSFVSESKEETVPLNTDTIQSYSVNDSIDQSNEQLLIETPSKKRKIISILKNSKDYFLGIIAAVGCGTFGGSMFVPTKFEKNPGVVYMIGFGFGSLTITTVILIVYLPYYYIRHRKIVAFYPKLAIFPAISAVLWQTGK